LQKSHTRQIITPLNPSYSEMVERGQFAPWAADKLETTFPETSRMVENGFRRIYNSREFQAKKSLGTLCRATLVKLQFFLTLLLQKCLFKWWWGGRGKDRALSFPSHPEQQTLAWKAQEKEPIGTLYCWSVGGSYVQMEWSGKLRLST
jgi:hypothetical protein